MTKEELKVIQEATVRGVAIAHKPFLGIDEAAIFMGWSPRKIYSLIQSGRLSLYKDARSGG